MGHIKEPDGIDFVVDSKPLTHPEREQISEIIAHYKATGRKIKLPKIIGRKKSGRQQQFYKKQRAEEDK